MKDPYVSCYFSGRFDAFEGEVDMDKLIEKVQSGAPLRESTLDAAKKAIASEMDTATKMLWIKDNLEEIRELGGDSEKSWRLYVQGRADALAYQLENEVVDAIEEEDDEYEDLVEKTPADDDDDDDADDSDQDDED